MYIPQMYKKTVMYLTRRYKNSIMFITWMNTSDLSSLCMPKKANSCIRKCLKTSLKRTLLPRSHVRSFMAIEKDTPVDEEAEAAERSFLEEYHQKLVVNGEVYPDPNTLKTGWEGELAAMDKWPNNKHVHNTRV
ncbi:hypothetical protein ACOMHN_018327 [Nucella lapillus]